MKNTEKAFIWITDILEKYNFPYVVTGGLAAKIYGSPRELNDIDIDIHDKDISVILEDVKPYIIFGPKLYKDKGWDLLLMTLNYEGQEIDLSGGDSIKICDARTGEWQNVPTNFFDIEKRNIFGRTAPIISKENLVNYKSMLTGIHQQIDIDAVLRGDFNQTEKSLREKYQVKNQINFLAMFKWVLGRLVKGFLQQQKVRAIPWMMVDKQAFVLPLAENDIRITWLGHAGFMVDLPNGKTILFDPVLSNSLSGIVKREVPAPCSKELLKRADYIFISHDHLDHLSLKTLRGLNKPMFVGKGVEELVNKISPKVTSFDWWQTHEVDGMKITFVPTRHWSGRGLFDTGRRLWGGFVIEFLDKTIYFVGDTAYHKYFNEVRELFPSIDVVFMPIGCYEPKEIMSIYHIGPDVAVDIYQQIGAIHFIPMHWGTFRLSDEPLAEPPQKLRQIWKEKKLDENNLHIMKTGQTIILDL